MRTLLSHQIAINKCTADVVIVALKKEVIN
jgi:hypothetical protein